jgi:outer membrane biogenesis lipoprotein LolB
VIPFQRMKSLIRSVALIVLMSASILLSGCSTSEVADARTSGVERRQSRMDARTAARQERWRIRGEREDARAAARFDSW